MTYKSWQRLLLTYLSKLPEQERRHALEYYYELYLDKLEAGEHEENILAEFGTPRECAERILAENGIPMPPIAERPRSAKRSAAYIVGVFFFSLLILLPLAIGLLSILIGFGAICISGGAVSIAGIVYAVCSLFFAIGGMSAGGVLAHFGIGICASGVGTLLCIAFYYVTVYSAKGMYWLTKLLFEGGRKS